jgi:hypothetical protein
MGLVKPFNMKAFRHVAWLSTGVVLSYLHFDVVSSLVQEQVITGRYAPMALSFFASIVIGAVLCCRAPARAAWQLGAAIASYLPALYSLLWLVAGAQDLLRGDGLPGASLSIMMELPRSDMLMLVMVMTGITVTVSGRLCQRLIAALRVRRNHSDHPSAARG